MTSRMFGFIRNVRNRHIALLDMVILLATPLLALWLFVDSLEAISLLVTPLLTYTLIAMVIKVAVFLGMRFYKRYWWYASVDEMIVLAFGTLLSWVLCLAVFFGALRPADSIPLAFPATVPLIDGILTMLLVGGVRISVRMAYVLNERKKASVDCKKVLIVGAGITGSMIVKELRAMTELAMIPVAFVDDDLAKQQMIIHGVCVLGPISSIRKIVEEKKIDEVIIAMPTVSGKKIRDIVELCAALDIQAKTIPGIFDILSGSAVAQLRDVDIVDLLRREIVRIDEQDVAQFIHGAKVMVTGAGGSIGSELCRQIANYRPKVLVMLGHGENSIFQIENELKARHGKSAQTVTYTTVIADIRDRERMLQVMEEHRPHIIFHAAAHKHVGLMETNLPDAISNNISGTKLLVELAGLFGVEKFVMISSDKAVNPMCVMGVTKRVAELVVHDAAMRLRKPFVIVRFGNVLGSRGSIVPIFKKQIDKGGPVTITHPEVTRFFMTIPEAVQLVLQAGAMGTCGETFVLDMGKPVKIVDLARDLIRLSGLNEGSDIDIVFTGLKDGEKMHEELFYGNEEAIRSGHPKIFVCKNGHSVIGSKYLSGLIGELVAAAGEGDIEHMQEVLQKIVVQYRTPAIEPHERREYSSSDGQLVETIVGLGAMASSATDCRK